jgi:hypothetical protein
MIFNADITDRLMDLFGEGVLEWSHSKIRNRLEEAVSDSLEQVREEKTMVMKTIMAQAYNEIRSLDNDFTELYTSSLDEVSV